MSCDFNVYFGLVNSCLHIWFYQDWSLDWPQWLWKFMIQKRNWGSLGKVMFGVLGLVLAFLGLK